MTGADDWSYLERLDNTLSIGGTKSPANYEVSVTRYLVEIWPS